MRKFFTDDLHSVLVGEIIYQWNGFEIKPVKASSDLPIGGKYKYYAKQDNAEKFKKSQATSRERFLEVFYDF